MCFLAWARACVLRVSAHVITSACLCRAPSPNLRPLLHTHPANARTQQALPGPLFNFSAYLGAIMATNAGHVFIVGTLLAWFGLFMPGIMVRRGAAPAKEGDALCLRAFGACPAGASSQLDSGRGVIAGSRLRYVARRRRDLDFAHPPPSQIIFGIMPYWGSFRNWAVYRRALPGFNAAGVGLIITSVFSLALGAMRVRSRRPSEGGWRVQRPGGPLPPSSCPPPTRGQLAPSPVPLPSLASPAPSPLNPHPVPSPRTRPSPRRPSASASSASPRLTS